MNCAYVTLLSSEDYLQPVLILNRNLKELNTNYPLHVMVTDTVCQAVEPYLKKERIIYSVVPEIKYSKEIQNFLKGHYVLNTASKMNIFSLYSYEKVVYIDADSFFIKTVDELFNYPDGAMYDPGHHDEGFSAMFVCSPRYHDQKLYLEIFNFLPMLDGDLLAHLWFCFKSNPDYRIPQGYFINITIDNMEDYKPAQQYIHGVHFCYKYKPWKYRTAQAYLNDFYKEFKNFHSTVRDNLIKAYFDRYLIPLRRDYPELLN